jgi:nickel superoxide dismutase
VGSIEEPETCTRFNPNLKKPNRDMAGSLALNSNKYEVRKSMLTVHAHCDLPCGVYDPAQAKIEAQSVKACMEKYAASSDPDFKARAVSIKEARSNMVKEHLWVLWTDYFKPNHFEAYPQLHGLFNEATKLAGAAGTKGTVDVAVADKLIGKIDEIAEIFWATKK